MSRIHEALKKAEQERALQEGESQPASTNLPVEMPVQAAETPAGAAPNAPVSGPIPVTAAMPSVASSLNVDALLARSTMQSWIPDQKTMLFFNGNDNARGMEEFR